MNFSRFASALARLPILFIAVLCPYVASADESLQSYDIEAQPMDRALKAFAAQTEIQVAFAPETVEGLVAQAVEGDFVPENALQALIDDSGLDYEFASDKLVVVHAPQSNDQGGASDSGNARPTPVLMAQNQTSQAQTTASSRSEDKAETQVEQSAVPLEEIIVTGTNIRGVENPTVPVLTFDREDIALSGATTVDDFLRTIPQNFASETQLTAESGNPFTSGRNRSQGTSVDLRGLGGGSTLVLLNGRRLPFSGDAAIVDINVIPLGAIERIEVLTDGATAIYGSDAVGGVINFITGDDYKGLDINARYGRTTNGSMRDWSVGSTGGFSWSSGSAFIGVDYQEEEPLLAEERDFINLVNGREDATLGSKVERTGVSGSVKQEIGSKLRLNIDTFFSSTTSDSFSVTNSIPLANLSEQTLFSVNPSVKFDIIDRIAAAFFVDVTRNRTDTTRTFPLDDIVATDDFDNDLTAYEGRIYGKAFDLPGGTVSFALGGLFRSEEFETAEDGVVRTSGERDVWAGYGELLIPIFGDANALPLAQKLELSLAGRYEDYSDFGDSFDPKIGLYWEINSDLSLRASYSEAFRAPDLTSVSQLQLAIASGFPLSFATGQRPDEAPFIDEFFGLGPAFAYLLPTGGNPDLKPERAKTWSAGFAYEPGFLEGLSLEGNFFDVSYTDRLENVNFISSLQNPAFFSLADIDPDINEIQAFFDRAAAGDIIFSNQSGLGPEDIQILFSPTFTNVAERDVRGFDLTFNYIRETKFGEFSAGANATYLIDYIGRLTALAPSVDEINVLYRPVDLKMRGYLSLSGGGFTAFTAVNYVDSYRDEIDESIANKIDSWTTIDLSLSYETGTRSENGLVNNVRLGFNITNLFDNDPPFVATPFGLNFDSANATPWGRQVNFTITKSL